MNPADGTREAPALDVAEDALALLKRLEASAWVPYVSGTLLFLWTLLWFWAYMSRNAQAAGRLGEFSLLLALAYVIMKSCHAHFFGRLMAELQDDPAPRMPAGAMARTALYQALLQPAALFAVPFALLLTVPYPFVTAFFQCAQWVRPGESAGAWLARSLEMARLWPKQSAWLQVFLAATWVCVTANLFTAIAVGPALLKSLLGIETVFTRTDAALTNTTVVAMTAAIAWAVVDPFKKAIHAWRCFHGISRRSGLDLELGLARFRSLKTAGTAAAIGLLLIAAAAPAAAGGIPARPVLPATAEPARTAIDPQRLDGLLRAEIGESRYGWRLPRGRGENGEGSWIRMQYRKFLDWVETAMDRLEKWAKGMAGWFKRIFPGGNEGWDGKGAEPASKTRIRLVMLALAVLFAAGMAVFLIRRSRRESLQVAVPAPVTSPVAPDASSEDAKADDFPEDEWLAQVESLRAQGQERLAMRALFLATLSLLARKGWLTVARHKGNRDYQREVAARARRREGVADAFGENCRRFDRVWYGRHPVTGEDWEISRANFEAVRAHAG